MESLRALLRKELNQSLRALPEIDRLRAAWRVTCGREMAERGDVICFEGQIVTIAAEDDLWLRELRSQQRDLSRELARIAGVNVAGIHFCLGQRSGRRQQ